MQRFFGMNYHTKQQGIGLLKKLPVSDFSTDDNKGIFFECVNNKLCFTTDLIIRIKQ